MGGGSFWWWLAHSWPLHDGALSMFVYSLIIDWLPHNSVVSLCICLLIFANLITLLCLRVTALSACVALGHSLQLYLVIIDVLIFGTRLVLAFMHSSLGSLPVSTRASTCVATMQKFEWLHSEKWAEAHVAQATVPQGICFKHSSMQRLYVAWNIPSQKYEESVSFSDRKSCYDCMCRPHYHAYWREVC